MKIYLVTSEVADDSAYLEEMLKTYGLFYTMRCCLEAALEQAVPKQDVLILSAGSNSDGIESFVNQGGDLVTILPENSLLELAGLVRQEKFEPPTRLRFVENVCKPARGEALWLQGSCHQYQNLYEYHSPARPLAYLYNEVQQDSDTPAIIESPVGAGKIISYAYDLVECVKHLRQGFPERANSIPEGQTTPRLAYLQPSFPPQDTFWRPTADYHVQAFCEIIKNLQQRHAPVASLWHLPHDAASLLLYSGDEDNATQENNQRQMQELEASHAHMNLYAIPEITSLTSELIDEYTQRGHAVSVHPNLVPASNQAPAQQIELARREVLLFQEKFQRPIHTVRNHCYMWPGYLELPELWEELGIGMDCNSTSLMFGFNQGFGPFVKLNTAMPMRFVREDGRLIDVFQQPTQINDDLQCHVNAPKSMKYAIDEFEAIIQRIIDDAVYVYSAPICVNIHPQNYVLFADRYSDAIIKIARQYGLEIWSIDRWHNFWRARDSWKSTATQWQNQTLTLELKGREMEGLTLHIPSHFQALELKQISINNLPQNFTVQSRGGALYVPVILPNDTTTVILTVSYAAL